MIDSEVREIYQFVTLAWLFLAGAMFGGGSFLIGPIYRQRPAFGFWVVLSLFIVTGSALMSDEPLRSLAFVGSAAIGLTCCSGVWQWLYSNLTPALATYSVLGSLLIALRYFTASEESVRLTLSEVTHANHLGLIALGTTMTCLAIRSKIVAGMAISINFLGIVAAQSRGALVAAFVGFAIYASLRLVVVRRNRSTWIIVISGLILIAALIIWSDLIENFITSLLLLNDRYRGLGSGFTGRLEAWKEAFGLFLESPWFGVGFRMHERYMTILPSSHSGYFTLLAETGILGTLCVMIVVIAGAVRLVRTACQGHRIAALGAGLVGGYLFLAIFERVFISIGNPTSILAWMFLLMPKRNGDPIPESPTAVESSAHLRLHHLLRT
jgi:O-antigen ligase